MGSYKDIIDIKLIFSGRVQGVAFRYHAKNMAEKLGLKGSVKNLSDGRVELFVQGSRSDIDHLMAYLSGPSGPGEVLDMKQIVLHKRAIFSGFEIL